jgi:predicted dehydrogenase
MTIANKNTASRWTRRAFIKRFSIAAGASIGFPLIAPSGIFGENAPSNRIRIGCIGTGGMGMQNLRGFLHQPSAQIVAVCDVDRNHLQAALQTAGLDPSDGTGDFRRVLARNDIDAVVIATPDHWHVPIALAAVKAGKDVYCEKPLTLAIQEGRDLADAVQSCGRIFQTGSHQRSDANFRKACELVRNGRVGRLQTIDVEIPPNNRQCPPDGWQPQPIPDELDYNMWLGPALWAPYTKLRCHYTFRFISDYSGGQITNWGAHHIDIAQWGHGTDLTGPVQVEGKGEIPRDGLFDTPLSYDLIFTYADGVRLLCRTGGGSGSVTFRGDEGEIYVNRGQIRSHPQSILKSAVKPGEIRLYRSPNHQKNFLECIRSRKTTVAPAEIGHRTMTICHMGNMALRLKRALRWDPAKEEFIDDEQANRLKYRAMRAPWDLKMVI